MVNPLKVGKLIQAIKASGGDVAKEMQKLGGRNVTDEVAEVVNEGLLNRRRYYLDMYPERALNRNMKGLVQDYAGHAPEDLGGGYRFFFDTPEEIERFKGAVGRTPDLPDADFELSDLRQLEREMTRPPLTAKDKRELGLK
jgi:hypothetical protein